MKTSYKKRTSTPAKFKMEFYHVEGKDTIPVPKHVNSLFLLSNHLMRYFIEHHISEVMMAPGIKYGMKGKFAVISDILDKQESGEYTFENCSNVIAQYILSKFNLVKGETRAKLSNKDTGQLDFYFNRDLKNILEKNGHIQGIDSFKKITANK